MLCPGIVGDRHLLPGFEETWIHIISGPRQCQSQIGLDVHSFILPGSYSGLCESFIMYLGDNLQQGHIDLWLGDPLAYNQ